ncbi:MAG: M14 family zinc carboxypeptidase [Actinomycetota bacterium]
MRRRDGSIRRRTIALTLAITGAIAAACAGSDTESVQIPPFGDAPTATTDRDDETAVDASPTSTTDPTTTTSTTTTLPATTTSTTTTTTTLPPTTTSTTTTTTTVDIPPPTGPPPCPPTGRPVWEIRPPSDLPAPPLPDDWTTEEIGISGAGRQIIGLVRRVPDATRQVMVIGGIHGNEPAGPPSARAMVDADIPDDTELWLIPDLNPDGTLAGPRCNGSGVDLNRNFSWDWRPSTGGPGPLSEPEPQAITALIERERPDLVVWIHQPLDYVSAVGQTPDVYESAWSFGSGLPIRPDVTQHGGGESWTWFEAGIPSILVEIDGWDATQEIVDAQVRGLEAVLRVVQPLASSVRQPAGQ